METIMPKTASCSVGSRCYGDLRGVQWRIGLGILPSSHSPLIDDLRRVTANSRRRYAVARKQLLVDPHVTKDGSHSPDVVMDNPLSQNPDSMWGRFFKNAELERMVDQDLTRLYPERGSYFQTSGCQGMLRRILLLWCLSHPEYGYRQGMHELLAPLLYVLHVDVERLTEVRKTHEDHFADKFDGVSYHENDLTYKLDFQKFSESAGDGSEIDKNLVKTNSLTELDPVIQTIILLSDAYGAESELGIVLSEKFMEHDAYSMFDALMSGAGGAVAMAEFFSPSPYGSSHTGFSPVIEASLAMYQLLSVVDSSLHSHLVELGVEPQYFSLRWLRVLFGREFSLEDLLIIWDEVFACDNTKSKKAADNDAELNFGVLASPRGAFVSAFAVSMILTLRSSLLATENATLCLQRLLNFPDDVNLAKLIAKAKSLQALAADVNNSNSLLFYPGLYDGKKPATTRGRSLSIDSTYATTALNVVPESYWEEKWRVLHKEEEHKQGAEKEKVPSIRSGWSERVRSSLSRTKSDTLPSTKNGSTKLPEPSVRRSLLEDLARQLGSDDNKENSGCDEVEYQGPVEVNGQDVTGNNFSNTLSASHSEENSPNFSDPPSPIHGNGEQEDRSESSSVASNSSVDENYAEPCRTNTKRPPLPISTNPLDLSSKCTQNDEATEKSITGMKERKILLGKFQWLRRFGWNTTEGTSEDAKVCSCGRVQNNVAGSPIADGCESSSGTSKDETVDQKVMVSLRSLGQTMLENIQVIESVIQQDRSQMAMPDSKNGFVVGNGQVTAISALKELRRISGLLSQM